LGCESAEMAANYTVFVNCLPLDERSIAPLLGTNEQRLEFVANRRTRPGRSPVQITDSCSDRRFTEQFRTGLNRCDECIRRLWTPRPRAESNKTLAPRRSDATNFRHCGLHDEVVACSRRLAVLHRQINDHDLQSPLRERVEGEPNRLKRFASRRLEPRHVDAVVDMVIRIKLAEAGTDGQLVDHNHPLFPNNGCSVPDRSVTNIG
jgi:hypothetical protein